MAIPKKKYVLNDLIDLSNHQRNKHQWKNRAQLAIETDLQLALELPDIVNGKDRLQSKQTCLYFKNVVLNNTRLIAVFHVLASSMYKLC